MSGAAKPAKTTVEETRPVLVGSLNRDTVAHAVVLPALLATHGISGVHQLARSGVGRLGHAAIRGVLLQAIAPPIVDVAKYITVRVAPLHAVGMPVVFELGASTVLVHLSKQLAVFVELVEDDSTAQIFDVFELTVGVVVEVDRVTRWIGHLLQ